MNKQRLPGFNAEACLYKASRFYMARPAGASLSFNGEQVRPAQIGLVREPPGSIIPWPSNRPLPPWIQELQRQRECKLNARSSQCYSNCTNKYVQAATKTRTGPRNIWITTALGFLKNVAKTRGTITVVFATRTDVTGDVFSASGRGGWTRARSMRRLLPKPTKN
jgi:hypothetical protein